MTTEGAGSSFSIVSTVASAGPFSNEQQEWLSEFSKHQSASLFGATSSGSASSSTSATGTSTTTAPGSSMMSQAGEFVVHSCCCTVQYLVLNKTNLCQA